MAKNNKKPAETLNNGREKPAKQKGTVMKMAEKRANQQKNQTKKKKEKGRLKEYFKGVRLEMKKVVWPTRSELGSYTAVVLATCAAFALLFWGVDSGVLAAIKAICF